MSQAELLKRLFEVFRRLGIDAMVVGSHASSFYGEARSTHDIDIVVDLDQSKISELCEAFPPPKYYLSDAALREGRMANLIDIESGDKADLFLLHDAAAARLEFSRRVDAMLFDTDVTLATAEDTILAKLRWYRETESDRQLTDIRHILGRQQYKLDVNYLRRRISEDGLQAVWRLIQDEE